MLMDLIGPKGRNAARIVSSFNSKEIKSEKCFGKALKRA